jgi:hypothetical protein
VHQSACQRFFPAADKKHNSVAAAERKGSNAKNATKLELGGVKTKCHSSTGFHFLLMMKKEREEDFFPLTIETFKKCSIAL